MTPERTPQGTQANYPIPVALVCTHDCEDISAWSGIPYYLSRSLVKEPELDVHVVSPLEIPSVRRPFLQRQLDRLLAPEGRIWDHYEPAIMKSVARAAATRVATDRTVFSIFPDPWVYAEKDQPWIFFSDATFAGLRRLYPALGNLHQRSLRNGEAFWRRSVERADGMVFSSDWAARSAIEDYGATPEKVAVIPMGANLDPMPSGETVKTAVSERSRDHLNLLWMGVDWKRKGGKIAVETVRKLRGQGVSATLHVVGCDPPETPPDFVQSHGFLNKRVPADRQMIERLFLDSHFFLLPTVADCTPIVFPEANAFGLPVVTHNIGGTSTMVIPGVNGCLASRDDFIAQATDYIVTTFSDHDKYMRACMAARDDQARRLCWKAFASQLSTFIRERATV